jgi:hypothetical protein
MELAHFRFAVGPTDRAPGTPVEVGSDVTVTVALRTTTTRDRATLNWELGWVVGGTVTETHPVDAGEVVLESLSPSDPTRVVNIKSRLPADGPVTYSGELLSVRWYVAASLDLLEDRDDPKGQQAFIVIPQGARELALQVSAGGGGSCPFCKDGIPESERRACDACGTPHHGECLQLHGGCSIPGCDGS